MKPASFYLFACGFLAAGVLLSLFAFPAANAAIFALRISKILNAAICGAALSAAGVLLQNLLKNPLADPYILGTSAGGTLGLFAAGLLGLSYFSFGFYFFIVAGSFLSVFLVCVLALGGGRASPVTVILAGVAVNILLSAVILLLLFAARQPYLSSISFMFGTVSERPGFVLLISAFLACAGFALAFLLSRGADTLALGSLQADALGTDVKKLKYLILFAVSLLVSGAVGLSGAIGFVGFMIPHTARLLTGPKVKTLLPAAAVLGAAFLVDMEFLNRLLFYPRQMPAGVLCALTGAPFFIWILLKNKGEYFDA
jgi:iron complex transport system permease protein